MKHAKLPHWINGIENKASIEKPGDNFFNGVTRKIKDDNSKKNVIVYKKQIDVNNIPVCYNYGHNIVNIEETE